MIHHWQSSSRSIIPGFGRNYDGNAVGGDDGGSGGVHVETRGEHRRQPGRRSGPNRKEIAAIPSRVEARRLGSSLTQKRPTDFVLLPLGEERKINQATKSNGFNLLLRSR